MAFDLSQLSDEALLSQTRMWIDLLNRAESKEECESIESNLKLFLDEIENRSKEY